MANDILSNTLISGGIPSAASNCSNSFNSSMPETNNLEYKDIPESWTKKEQNQHALEISGDADMRRDKE
jgi:hypothetical protein